MYDDIKNKRVLVVGASKGIGRQLCHAIHQLGGHVQAASRDIATLSNGLSQTDSNDQLFLVTSNNLVQFKFGAKLKPS